MPNDTTRPRGKQPLNSTVARVLLVILSAVMVLGITVALPRLQDFWLWHFTEGGEWKCSDGEAIALALGFTHDGLLTTEKPTPVTRPVVVPGSANQRLADWLKDHSRCFSAIYTQRGISDAWLKAGELVYPTENIPTESSDALLKDTDTRIYQMHAHVGGPDSVRTLEALHAAVDRIRGFSNQRIVLVTHDAQYWRAYFDLLSLVDPARIVNPRIRAVPFPASQGRVCWYLREIFARAIEWYQRQGNSEVRPSVTLAPVVPWKLE